MILDYEKLFEPYTRDGHALENSLRYLKKLADGAGIPQEIVDLAVQETFVEVANGEAYSLDHCPCGCGIDKAGTAITHHMRDRMRSIDHQIRGEYKKMLNDRYNAGILGHIHAQNEQFTKEHLGPLWLLDWERSWILRGLRWTGGLFRRRKPG